MIVKLFCPRCAYEASKNFEGHTVLDIPVPVSRLTDNGQYEVHCGKGHVSAVILDNVKLELLFEMGLNAIIDGYPREAVSSFASSLERFYTFYWHVVMRHFGIPIDQADATWKPLSKLSERQVGAYSTAVNLLTKCAPKLLSPNKQVPFRNKVIHNGYVPTEEEAISFGDVVMGLINNDLSILRLHAADALESVYKEFSPKDYDAEPNGDDSIIVGCVNVLTAIDARHPPKGDDKRVGGVADQFQRIIAERQPTSMQLLSEEEMKKIFPEKELPKLKQLSS
ncbi:MAG: hypothetical protein WC560_11520 [Syntrophales bacterium]